MKYLLLIFLLFAFNLNAQNDDFLNFELTKEELDYLKNKKELKLCIDPNWLPFEKIEDGKHIGISAEIMQEISSKIETPITLLNTLSWSQSLDKMKTRECDILSLTVITPLKKVYLDFTSPYIKIPLVIATQIGLPFVDNLNKIKEKPIGVVKDYSTIEILKNKYPDINLVEVDSVQDGLKLVQEEKIFGFLDNSMVINNQIYKNNIKNIAISGQFIESYDLSVASRNDEPILNEILQKAILSISENKKNYFIEKWNNLQYKVQTDYKLIIQIISISLLLISLSFYWNIRLKKEIRKNKLAKKQLKESEEKYRILFDIAPVLLDSFDENGKIVLWNKECEKVFGWSLKEVQEAENQMILFYDENTKATLIEDFKLNNGVFKEWYPKRKDGKILVVKWANVKLPNGEIIHIGHDITEQRRNEVLLQQNTLTLEFAKNQLERLNESLEEKIKEELEKNTKQQLIFMQQTKLAQMGEMIHNIAHQWRQPLTQINSAVLLLDAYLNKKACMDEDIESKISQIESLTEYLSRTIGDFQNFFEQNNNKYLFKIYDVFISSQVIIKGQIEVNNIKVISKIEDNLELFGCINKLQQVLLILMNNAIDSIVLNKIKDPEIIVTAFFEDSFLIIKIEDNALGINPTNIYKVFDPYFTTKHKSQGTGVGLYMAKIIIENVFLGELNAENCKNGAIFTIKIPKGESL